MKIQPPLRTTLLRGAALIAITAALWGAGCNGNDPIGPVDPQLIAGDPLVSDPTLAPPSASTTGTVGFELYEMSRASNVAYVSLPPGSIPDADRATPQRRGGPTTVTTAMIDGGFDPVPVTAAAGQP